MQRGYYGHLALLMLVITPPSQAQQRIAAGPLLPLSFLVGRWSTGKGQIAETGGTSTGRSEITVEANGNALLRRDHTELFDTSGKPSGGFEQIMLIYPEAGTIHADYSDGTHIIHYTQTTAVAGRSVTFTGSAAPGLPVFRLSYELTSPATLAVAFGMMLPGSAQFRPIATGKLTKAP